MTITATAHTDMVLLHIFLHPLSCGCVQVRMCLVINKMDRLVHELRMSPGEAFERLQGIVTHVNMIVSAFQSEHFISEADAFVTLSAGEDKG